MTTTTRLKTDSRIQKDVLRELKWDTRVEETDVGVEVDDSIVTLTGSVPTYVKKLAAEQAAHRVYGVFDVANNVHVIWPGSAISDTEIARSIRPVLDRELPLPDETVATTVRDGTVTLTGIVHLFAHRDEVVRAVRRLHGVCAVIDKIKVRPTKATAAEVRDAIGDALDRQAILESERVRVEVRDGVVTLSGTVRSWSEKHAITEAAQFTPGVCDVTCNVLVNPYGEIQE